MKNSQKTVYLIAILAIIILISQGVYSIRFFNGYLLNEKAMIALNAENIHGVVIERDSEIISFENGSVLKMNISSIPTDEVSVISLAIPLENLEPNTTYQAKLSFKLETNSPSAITIKSNGGITSEQTSFENDINFKPISINNGDYEYSVLVSFATNEEGTGYIIYDFGVDESIETLSIQMGSVIFSDFKEIKDDTIDTEQTSETTIEII